MEMCFHKNQISKAWKKKRMFMFAMEVLTGYPYKYQLYLMVNYVWNK